MGHFLGIQRFSDKIAYDAMTQGLNQVQARDQKADCESESTADHLRKLLSRKYTHHLNKTEFFQAPEIYSPAERSIF
jgi:hypothetical protein